VSVFPIGQLNKSVSLLQRTAMFVCSVSRLASGRRTVCRPLTPPLRQHQPSRPCLGTARPKHLHPYHLLHCL